MPPCVQLCTKGNELLHLDKGRTALQRDCSFLGEAGSEPCCPQNQLRRGRSNHAGERCALCRGGAAHFPWCKAGRTEAYSCLSGAQKAGGTWHPCALPWLALLATPHN